MDTSTGAVTRFEDQHLMILSSQFVRGSQTRHPRAKN
jgi:hypothetical protein